MQPGIVIGKFSPGTLNDFIRKSGYPWERTPGEVPIVISEIESSLRTFTANQGKICRQIVLVYLQYQGIQLATNFFSDHSTKLSFQCFTSH